VPPTKSCLNVGPPSPEVTEAFCRVPSASFSQAPWYSLPVHLCWFGVRSIWWGYFLGQFRGPLNPIRENNLHHPSHPTRFRNINLIPIDYAFPPRLRGRLTLRRLALRRKPWTFGDSASHTVYRYSCQHSHFRYLHRPLQDSFTGLRNAPLPLAQRANPQLRYISLAPVHLRRKTA